MTTLSDLDLRDLRKARHLLEEVSFAMRVADFVGKPVEWGMRALPKRAQRAVGFATDKALRAAMRAAVITMKDRSLAPPRNWLHSGTAVASGAAGGFFGLSALPLELPVSTVVMLRSIAAHARAQGEDLSDVETRLQCVSVFGLGGRSAEDDAAEAGYLATRIVLARAVSETAEYIAERGAAKALADRAAPVLARFIARVAQRFGPMVAEKVAAEAAPVIGAVGGAGLNLVFIRHFQDVAWGHFTVRRLEREHGVEAVRSAYERLG